MHKIEPKNPPTKPKPTHHIIALHSSAILCPSCGQPIGITLKYDYACTSCDYFLPLGIHSEERLTLRVCKGGCQRNLTFEQFLKGRQCDDCSIPDDESEFDLDLEMEREYDEKEKAKREGEEERREGRKGKENEGEGEGKQEMDVDCDAWSSSSGEDVGGERPVSRLHHVHCLI